jgi:adenylate cyclase
MFADIVGHRISSAMTPPSWYRSMTSLAPSTAVERHGLEKVKTIGDAYLVVGGLSEASVDHADRMASMALDLAEAVGRIEAAARLGIRFRIGIHRGPVVAGIIGSKKFIYDVWGDTVNLASRMESSGVPGRVQVSYAVKASLEPRFRFEARGLVDVKGKGPMPTWFLVGHSSTTTVAAAAGEAAVGG